MLLSRRSLTESGYGPADETLHIHVRFTPAELSPPPTRRRLRQVEAIAYAAWDVVELDAADAISAPSAPLTLHEAASKTPYTLKVRVRGGRLRHRDADGAHYALWVAVRPTTTTAAHSRGGGDVRRTTTAKPILLIRLIIPIKKVACSLSASTL